MQALVVCFLEGSDLRYRHIYWETTVVLFGEPNPVLVVDQFGTIVDKTPNVDVRAFDRAAGTFSGPLGVGDTIAVDQWIVVGDLLNDGQGYARFETNWDAIDELVPVVFNQIWGNAGEFRIKQTWDSVTITNFSDRTLVTNDIDTVLSTEPLVEVDVDEIHGPTNAPADGVSLPETAPVAADSTFEFDISHDFAKTEVAISSLQAAGADVDDADIVLDGRIDNAIGRTSIINVRGNVFADEGSWVAGCSPGVDCGLGIESTGVEPPSGSIQDGPVARPAIFAVTQPDTDVEWIRTNRLLLDVPGGSAGRQSTTGITRVPIPVEVVRFVDETAAFFDVEVIARAAGDLVMDLVFSQRSDPAAPAGTVDWFVDTLHAGDDVDVLVGDAVWGTDAGSLTALTVNLFAQPSGALIPSGPGGTGSFADAQSGDYLTHFRPDGVPGAGFANVLRAIANGQRVVVGGTVTFGDLGGAAGDVRAGDTIDVRHDGQTVVDFVVHTDVDAQVLPYAPHPGDDGL